MLRNVCQHQRELAADHGGEARDALVADLLEEPADVGAAVRGAQQVDEPDREPGGDEHDGEQRDRLLGDALVVEQQAEEEVRRRGGDRAAEVLAEDTARRRRRR